MGLASSIASNSSPFFVLEAPDFPHELGASSFVAVFVVFAAAFVGGDLQEKRTKVIYRNAEIKYISFARQNSSGVEQLTRNEQVKGSIPFFGSQNEEASHELASFILCHIWKELKRAVVKRSGRNASVASRPAGSLPGHRKGEPREP